MIWIWYEINTCTQCTPPSGVMANVETLEQACSHHLLCEIMQHVCRELDINVSACSCSYSDCKMCFNTRKQHNKVSFLNWAGKSFECCLVKCCLMKMKPSVKEGHSESHMVWKLMARWSSIQKKKKRFCLIITPLQPLSLQLGVCFHSLPSKQCISLYLTW